MRLLSAMTVGSLRMMPLPARVDERVRGTEVDREVARQGAAPLLRPAARAARRSRARARASPRSNSSMLCSIEVGRRLRNSTTAMPTALADDGEQQEGHVVCRPRSRTRRRRIGCCSTAQSEPPDQCSCFQIGTRLLSVSIANACRLERGARDAATRRRRPPTAPTARARRRGAAARPARRPASAAAARPTISLIARGRRLLVGLVGHAAHAVAALGVIAHDARGT